MSTLLLTGAGPASGSFDPASIAGLKLWSKADALALSDGAAVASWADSSGNGQTWTQATSGNRPIYKTAIVNGQPVVRFTSASSHFLSGPNLSALTAGTAFVAVKINTDPPIAANSGLWNLGADGVNSTHFPFSDGTIYDATGSTVRKTTVDPTPSLSAAFRIYAVSSASGAWTSYLDGTQLFTTATNTVGFSAAAKLGEALSAAYHLNGDVAELLVYDTALSTGDRAAVTNYLKAKYGL